MGVLQTLQIAMAGPAAAAVLLVLVAIIMGGDFASSRLRARIV